MNHKQPLDDPVSRRRLVGVVSVVAMSHCVPSRDPDGTRKMGKRRRTVQPTLGRIRHSITVDLVEDTNRHGSFHPCHCSSLFRDLNLHFLESAWNRVRERGASHKNDTMIFYHHLFKIKYELPVEQCSHDAKSSTFVGRHSIIITILPR